MKSWIVAAVAALLLAGCADPPPPWHSRGDRLLGLGSDQAEDPVSGTMVEKKKAVTRDYRGTTYYFESTETAELFDRNPVPFAISENLPLEEKDRDVR